MAGFSAAIPEPFSTQQMGFDDITDETTSRFYQMVPAGGTRRVTVEHERDLVLNILPGGFVNVKNAATGAGLPDKFALHGNGKLDIVIEGLKEGRQIIVIQEGVSEIPCTVWRLTIMRPWP